MAGFVDWYINIAAKANNGYSIILASKDLYTLLLGKPQNSRGHSHRRLVMPKTRLMICKVGTGLTESSKFFVRKSQNILGQKKPSRAAATWSNTLSISLYVRYRQGLKTYRLLRSRRSGVPDDSWWACPWWVVLQSMSWWLVSHDFGVWSCVWSMRNATACFPRPFRYLFLGGYNRLCSQKCSEKVIVGSGRFVKRNEGYFDQMDRISFED